MSSTMAIDSRGRALPTQLGEEAVDCHPSLIATGETAPFGADESIQRVAAIDRRSEILARIAHAIDKQGLAIRLKFRKEGVAGDELRPRLQVQQRFRRASRSWIKSNDTLVGRAVNEERKPDRDAEGLPLGI